MTKFDGKKIEQLRAQNGWSQNYLAKIVGCKRQSVIQWESNQVAPTARTLGRLAEAGQVSVQYFFTQEM